MGAYIVWNILHLRLFGKTERQKKKEGNELVMIPCPHPSQLWKYAIVFWKTYILHTGTCQYEQSIRFVIFICRFAEGRRSGTIFFSFFSAEGRRVGVRHVLCAEQGWHHSVCCVRAAKTRLWGPGKSTVGVDFVKRWYVVHNDLWKRQVCCLTQNWHYTVSFAMKPLASVWSMWHRWI